MSYRYDAESGSFISGTHERIAELIKAYDETLELAWIPPNKRNFNDTQPFAIICRPPGKPEYVVRRLREDELDHRLLAWLFTNDNEKNSPLQMIVAEEESRQLLEMAQRAEEMAERDEIALSILKSPLHTYKHAGKVYH